MTSSYDVDSIIDNHLNEAFEQIDNSRGETKPSEIMSMLERDWGLGDKWADWWTAFDSEGWE